MEEIHTQSQEIRWLSALLEKKIAHFRKIAKIAESCSRRCASSSATYTEARGVKSGDIQCDAWNCKCYIGYRYNTLCPIDVKVIIGSTSHKQGTVWRRADRRGTWFSLNQPCHVHFLTVYRDDLPPLPIDCLIKEDNLFIHQQERKNKCKQHASQ